MQETKPQASVMLSNSVAMEVGTNNVVIIGAFDGVQSNIYPTRVSFYAVAKVWGMPAQENTCTLKLVEAESGKVVVEAGEHKFATAGAHAIHTAISLFRNVTLPKSGLYEVRAYAGDQVLGYYPLVAGAGA